MAWRRLTSGGGHVSSSRQATNPIQQIMTWQNRKLLMCYEMEERCWNKVVKRRRIVDDSDEGMVLVGDHDDESLDQNSIFDDVSSDDDSFVHRW